MVTLDDALDVTALVHYNSLARGEQPAVHSVVDIGRPDGTRTLTYQELDLRARRIACWLRPRVAIGDRVLLLYADSLDFAAGFFGCLYAGAVAVPAPLPGNHHQQHRLTSIAKNADVAAVFVDTTSLPAVSAWTEAFGLTHVPVHTTSAGKERGDDTWSAPRLGRDALALLQYTSGSTSAPKGVMISHGNLLTNISGLCRGFGFDEHTRFGGWIPLYHDMGLIGLLLEALFLGSTCALMAPGTFLRHPHWWLKMIDQYDVTVTAAPNFAYELCCRQVTDAQIAELDLSRWRFAVNGSEPIRPSTLEHFAQRFAPAGFRADAMIPCFGLAEATLIVSGTSGRLPVVRNIDPDLLERHRFAPVAEEESGRELVSCGASLGLDVRIVDPETHQRLPDGAVGEIWLRGASIAAGYWRNEEASRATFNARTADGDPGFLRTGDLGAMHEGELHVTGRLKETIIIHGRNLYPQDIEHELRVRHESLAGLVGAAFTVRVEDAGSLTGEALVVLHEIRGQWSAEELSELTTRLKEAVARVFGVPVAGVVLLRPGSIRRTTSGKIQRAAMRELYLSGELSPLAPQPEPSRLDSLQGRRAGRKDGSTG